MADEISDDTAAGNAIEAAAGTTADGPVELELATGETATAETATAAHQIFVGMGEMAARCRAVDWAATPLGPVESWPAELRTTVRLLLAAPVATSLWCGPSYTLLYNDAYRRILAAKHPAALGRSGADVWDELWPTLEPQFAQVRADGRAIYADEALLRMERLAGGEVEDAWFTYALSAVTDDAGTCLAVYNVAVEISEPVRTRHALVEANAQLEEQQLELELTNQQLQDNAAELEMQATELQATAAQLEERTEEAEAEQARAEGILESMADAYFALDAEFRFTAVNATMERGGGLPRAELLGRTIWEQFPGTVGTDFERHYRRVATEPVEAHFTHDYSDGRLELVVDVDAYPAPGGGIAVFWRDVTERSRAEAALRANEARQTFLVRLGDTLRPLADPTKIQAAAARVLGEHLRANRVFYVEVEPDDEHVVVDANYTDGVPDLVGRYPLSSYGPTLAAEYRAGHTVIIRDTYDDPHVPEPLRAGWAAIGSRALVGVPLVKGGRFTAALGVDQAAPRAWTVAEISLVKETAERTWAAVERARAESALREREAKYRLIFDAIDEGLCVIEVLVDADGRPVDYRFLEANRLFEEQTGLVNAVGRTARELVPELEAHWFETYGRIARTGVPQRFQQGSDAMDRWFDVFAFRVGTSEERRVGILFKDVSAAKAADRERERLLAESEAARGAADLERRRLQTLVEHLPVGVTLAEAPSGQLLMSNAAVRRIWGLDTPAARVADYSHHYVGYRPGTDRPYASDEWPLARALTRREVVTDEVIEIVRPDGSHRLVSVSAAPVRDGGDRVLGGVVTSLDVTEHVQARRELERVLAESQRARTDAEAARARLEAVLASIADAFYLLDREWRFTYVNDAAEPLLQTTREALLGRTLWDAFPGVAGSVFEGPYREAMAIGHVTSAEAHFEPLGTWFDVRTYPWSGGLMVHFRDIGARKAAEAERERLFIDAEAARREAEDARSAAEVARIAAEAANRAKSEFLAVMSHELRTPLNAIGGYAELMELGIRGPVTPQQVEDLRRVQTSQRHLLGLINEVLNYAKLETGAVDFRPSAVLLAEALAEAEALVAPQARAKGLTLTIGACPPELTAHADAEKLRQILVNLLSNAVKFTETGDGQPGQIELSCAAEGESAVVRVRDTGIGIPADKLEVIFDPFVQVRAGLTRTADGTGLGLAISRDLARGMGGDLTAESTVGVGSVFTLTLPDVSPENDDRSEVEIR